jgi:hypothetical protein
MRLSPLRRVQHDLESHLGLAEGEEIHAATDAGIFWRRAEVCVRSRSGWATAVGFAKGKCTSGWRALAKEALEVILRSRDVIAALWEGGTMRSVPL